MWVNLLCIFVAVPLVISWPAGYDEHALEEPLADDVPAYFKGIKKTAFTFAFHVHFVHSALKSLKMSRSANIANIANVCLKFRAKNQN